MNVGTHESVKVSKCYGETRGTRERRARAVKVIFNRFFFFPRAASRRVNFHILIGFPRACLINLPPRANHSLDCLIARVGCADLTKIHRCRILFHTPIRNIHNRRQRPECSTAAKSLIALF